MRIDWWTLALQTVNVLVLVWILGRFFFRPIADIVARRQSEAGRIMAEAAAARQQAAELKAQAEATHDRLDEERGNLLRGARQAAQAEKAELLAQASSDIAKLRGEAQAAILQQQQAAELAVVARASELSVDIARRLLQRLPARLALSAFVQGLCGEITALAPEARSLLAAADAAHPLEVVSAVPLAEDETILLRDALRGALGVAPPLTFRAEPALIAGLELRGRHTVVRNNWQADLGRIREELIHGGHDGQA